MKLLQHSQIYIWVLEFMKIVRFKFSAMKIHANCPIKTERRSAVILGGSLISDRCRKPTLGGGNRPPTYRFPGDYVNGPVLSRNRNMDDFYKSWLGKGENCEKIFESKNQTDSGKMGSESVWMVKMKWRVHKPIVMAVHGYGLYNIYAKHCTNEQKTCSWCML